MGSKSPPPFAKLSAGNLGILLKSTESGQKLRINLSDRLCESHVYSIDSNIAHLFIQ